MCCNVSINVSGCCNSTANANVYYSVMAWVSDSSWWYSVPFAQAGDVVLEAQAYALGNASVSALMLPNNVTTSIISPLVNNSIVANTGTWPFPNGAFVHVSLVR